ncbi:MAG: hypothetical protein CVV39_08520 [Planctomycetes bacterium HGW-Planctomycetes-1]|nr:MAG: hypothetical protein CVV39_08520 [Planctomycetes bacterium HGW-Planctomycetes-1]
MLCALLVVSSAFATPELDVYSFGGSLPSAGSYDWWYGCSPTSTGMLLGWYDRNGYSNLVPGGDAETSTFGNPIALVNSAIASSGHINDFYGGLSPSGGYNISGDDVVSPLHSFDCLADFMGTSQDAYDNSNGTTKFYFYTDNSPLTADDIYSAGYNNDYKTDYYNIDGMYGIGEYIQYAGYDAATLYSQRIYGYDGIEAGFTYEQYKAEIDAGRGVLIHVQGHTMYGYGYIDGTTTIQVYDTWAPDGQNPGTMAWGGSYGSMAHLGVTVVQIIPEPMTMVLLTLGSLMIRRRE